MDDLLHHYERELAFLRQRAKGFAERYPKIAGRLQVSTEIAEDPHVERMIESFALLTSRIHKRLDDDFPLFTETFLEVLYPHYLRPMPSASIVQFDIEGAQSQMSAPAIVPRGTQLQSKPVQGVNCRFRTCADVTLLPLKLATAAYRAAVSAPSGTRLPDGATSMLSLRFELQSSQLTLGGLEMDHLRLYLDGEAAQVSALREALAARAVGVMVQLDEVGPWATLSAAGRRAQPRLAGFEEEEALLEIDARSHPAYRLLTEYFAFPEKFNFIDLPWPREALRGSARQSLTLHVLFSQVRSDSDQSRLLEAVSPRQFVLGCAPVINLFKQRADPIRVTHQASAYPLVVDARRAYGHEVYSIDKVWRVQQTPQGDSVVEFKPFYSLQHTDLDSAGGRYWHAHRDESIAQQSPGYETELSIVDVDFNPAAPHADTLSVEVTATNRDLPTLLAIGHPGGDLTMDGGSVARAIRLLRKPTPSARFERGRGALWRLISHLSINHLSLAAGGADALREMIRLYDLTRGASTRRQVDGITALEYRPATAWLPGQPFATFVRGMEVRITVDEEAFVGSGLSVFVEVMDRFFALYVNANSFTQLVVLSDRSGEELFKCPARSGESPLV
ncbi:type VI secretion system baseplate subunit TssF [Ideonella sp. BN130291]|uniref:type VI secretion system baseplate subunit TssF n=1 Tax=Ideonella sp. BN130291 TaxID=3112940 RepID=UPI002E266E75|nr:type VI secretion system baseplate subunit TssF [Ideonella sp. BN130291]